MERMKESFVNNFITGKITDIGEIKSLHEKMQNEEDFKKELVAAKKIQSYGIFMGNINSTGFDLDEKYKSFRKKVRPYQLIFDLIKYAASVAAIFAFGFMAHNYLQGTTGSVMNEIRVPYGQMANVVLSDGSKVWLNSGSTIEYAGNFNRKVRKVKLSGEAMFDVVKNTSPFIVEANDVNVKVLGTIFNIEAYKEDDYQLVSLLEGKVELTAKNSKKKLTLSPGQIGKFSTSNKSLELYKGNIESLVHWKNGYIKFDDIAFKDLAVKLERWYNVKIIFEEPALKEFRFTGSVIKNKPIEQILDVLVLTTEIDYTVKTKKHTANEIVIKKMIH